MVKGNHLHLRSYPPLSHNFKMFKIQMAVDDDPVIQKEVEELLVKGAIEPSTSGVGFYSNVFVVPKHTGGL